ncbi:MAG: hypothetical protein JSV63_03865 [Candidatus Aenigmatarchaeota archaeon]|nr:MAG: hypothetical protein JSV63_03865 [Candidatus Aenigmarchaeota archaeon]
MKATALQLNEGTRPFYESAARIVRKETGQEIEFAAYTHGLRVFLPPDLDDVKTPEYPDDILTAFPHGFIAQDKNRESPYKLESSGAHTPADVDGRGFFDSDSENWYRVCWALPKV